MRTFGTLLKNELKLSIRNMNMVIFAIIMCPAKYSFRFAGGKRRGKDHSDRMYFGDKEGRPRLNFRPRP